MKASKEEKKLNAAKVAAQAMRDKMISMVILDSAPYTEEEVNTSSSASPEQVQELSYAEKRRRKVEELWGIEFETMRSAWLETGMYGYEDIIASAKAEELGKPWPGKELRPMTLENFATDVVEGVRLDTFRKPRVQRALQVLIQHCLIEVKWDILGIEIIPL
jgi:hypothetical protein